MDAQSADNKAPEDVLVRPRSNTRWLRRPIPFWASLGFSLLAIALVFALWWFLTAGAASEDRIVNKLTLPSPAETFAEFPDLWFKGELTLNTLATLRRVSLGFALAVAVGVPLGILAGCFTAVRSLLAPIVIFGRNIPIAALIPLSLIIFKTGEAQKVMFIFVACVAFVIADVTLAISDVSSRYLDTAYTLGANTWQSIVKVLVPLALPAVFDSARVLFGLAFGYIMLAEVIKSGDDEGGLGYLIALGQRRGYQEYIYLIILIIPMVALVIDRILFWIQRELFPYRYGGAGIFNQLLRGVLHLWDNVKCAMFKPRSPFDQLVSAHQDVEEKNAETSVIENGDGKKNDTGADQT